MRIQGPHPGERSSRILPGQYYDGETAKHYNYFRDYDPRIGRYVESDPVGLLGGINTYAHVSSDPMAFVDPAGLCATITKTRNGGWEDTGEGKDTLFSFTSPPIPHYDWEVGAGPDIGEASRNGRPGISPDVCSRLKGYKAASRDLSVLCCPTRIQVCAVLRRVQLQLLSTNPISVENRDARRVFWISDNGSSHRGPRSVQRLTQAFPNLVPVHGPIHASWLNQIEIYFFIVQRKALTPNDFLRLEDVQERLLRFQEYYESMATRFDWRFTRDDLMKLLRWINSQDQLRNAA